MGYALLACRVLLGLVLVASAGGKLRGGEAFRAFVEATRELGAPARRARSIAIAVVVGEIAAALSLAAPPNGFVGFALALPLLTAFTIAILGALRRGTNASCACFGASATPIGRRHVVRNAVLITVAGTGLALGAAGASNPTHLAGALTAVSCAVIGALVLISTDELAELFDLGSAPGPIGR
ncbi:hypothetical protein B4N89_41190 [Embleya scabrispora]|uniref:Methylamine utilisation protein MauE domain-containing protein n=1 Tax=Embleya scabrispora TaxID=159449 RepID=A0A1T3NJL8_9ACTN|nr:MauE/DoxX family redox-associated membrane protein [Embleya scabrispora]OPC77002.1 hypothetical protein B4N89_41190 [Embleya scabrispora]